MDKYTQNILKINKTICTNIAKKKELADDGLLAQNVIAQLRNFVEAIAIKIYSVDHEVELNQDGTKQAIKNIKRNDDLVFLKRFHRCLEVTDSHITVEPDAALRLMWRYYDYLIDCKEYLKKQFDLDVLSNIDDFPFEEDETLNSYNRQIANKVDSFRKIRITESPTNRFYIIKKKPFRVNGQRYYELTLTEADNKVSKFDRFIAFTNLNIPTFYAVHLRFQDSRINIINRSMPIKIIVGFKVSVRPCEFDNFFKIMGHATRIQTRNAEYSALMEYLTNTRLNLIDFLESDEDDFKRIKNQICNDIKTTPIFDGLTRCRKFYGYEGYNVLAYLLYRLNNNLIRAQYDSRQNANLSWLYLSYKCIPFDRMPFVNNPVGYNAVLSDLYDCIDITGREHELLARKIKTNTETNGQLYTPIEELTKFGDVAELINRYNANLYYKHVESSSLKLENGQVFISCYENDTVSIIKSLLERTKTHVEDYTEIVNNWLNASDYEVDDNSKKAILQNLFSTSGVAIIYGSAGTGKSTMIKHISNLYEYNSKIFLANTHAAIENLKRNIGKANENYYSTIKSFLNSNDNKECDVLFIDECSTVSNADMAAIMRTAKFGLLVLVGDIYQIESIKFGNWFYIAKDCMPKNAVFELDYVHRSAEHELLTLWNAVRKLDERMYDIMELNHFCSSMDDSIFDTFEEDQQIVLCLNYDGLYGINNINKFLQDDNKGKSITIGIEQYKVGDPIIFKETTRFENYFYNNLKGKIINIIDEGNCVKFTVEVDLNISPDSVDNFAPFVLEEPLHENKSVVTFEVGHFVNKDDDDKDDYNIVPFKVSYAVSIHKAQGLEFDSVKIIITDDIEDLITHNIFYTAITRAKNKLKIYWTQRAEQHILDRMHLMFNDRDVSILSQKFEIKINKK